MSRALRGAGLRARPGPVLLAFIMLAGAFPVVAPAQVRDTVLKLSVMPQDMVVVEGNKLYFWAVSLSGAPRQLHVLDCSDYSVIRVFALDGTGMFPRPTYNWRQNKYYLHGSLSDTGLYVFDCAGDSLLRRVRCGWYGAMAYNSLSDRLYVMCDTGYVFDCASDSLVKVIPQHAGYEFAVWDSVGNKIYTCDQRRNPCRFYVTDCNTDSVVATIPFGYDWVYMASVSPTFRRLYASGTGNAYIVDCAADTLLVRLGFRTNSWLPAVVDEGNGKVYWSARFDVADSIAVIDIAGDSVLRWLQPPAPRAVIWSMARAPWSNRLYVSWSGNVCAYDCTTDSLVGSTSDSGGVYMLCSPYDHKIYIASPSDSTIRVFRDELAGIAEAQTAPVKELRIHPNPARDWLELQSSAPADLIAIDGRRVAVLSPGRNDVRSLPAGVYFCCSTGAGASLSRKLVLHR